MVTVYGMNPQVGQSLDGLSSISALHFISIFVPVSISKKDRETYTLVFLFLELHVVCELYLWYSELLSLYSLISECIPCVFFCDQVTSLRMIFSSSIHLRKNFMKSLFLIAV